MKIRKYILLISLLLLLLIPLVGMQYSNEVKWSLNDFIIMGVILLSFGIILNKIIYHVGAFNKKIILISTLIILFFLLWAELAVGLFNSPFAGS
ncbi:MAG: hypothetical protein CBC56_004900 [Flavobacteriales bacterium TMED96]|nr:MAG: hypothetical protein CBC56_004900 [Flavobacteriales bacterium TMED96]|tara:strand:- start:3462 stop:3743 length:282 start_codon:yes stop_codon:yes gene_type:complete